MADCDNVKIKHLVRLMT